MNWKKMLEACQRITIPKISTLGMKLTFLSQSVQHACVSLSRARSFGMRSKHLVRSSKVKNRCQWLDKYPSEIHLFNCKRKRKQDNRINDRNMPISCTPSTTPIDMTSITAWKFWTTIFTRWKTSRIIRWNGIIDRCWLNCIDQPHRDENTQEEKCSEYWMHWRFVWSVQFEGGIYIYSIACYLLAADIHSHADDEERKTSFRRYDIGFLLNEYEKKGKRERETNYYQLEKISKMNYFKSTFQRKISFDAVLIKYEWVFLPRNLIFLNVSLLPRKSWNVPWV